MLLQGDVLGTQSQAKLGFSSSHKLISQNVQTSPEKLIKMESELPSPGSLQGSLERLPQRVISAHTQPHTVTPDRKKGVVVAAPNCLGGQQKALDGHKSD